MAGHIRRKGGGVKIFLSPEGKGGKKKGEKRERASFCAKRRRKWSNFKVCAKKKKKERGADVREKKKERGKKKEGKVSLPNGATRAFFFSTEKGKEAPTGNCSIRRGEKKKGEGERRMTEGIGSACSFGRRKEGVILFSQRKRKGGEKRVAKGARLCLRLPRFPKRGKKGGKDAFDFSEQEEKERKGLLNYEISFVREGKRKNAHWKKKKKGGGLIGLGGPFRARGEGRRVRFNQKLEGMTHMQGKKGGEKKQKERKKKRRGKQTTRGEKCLFSHEVKERRERKLPSDLPSEGKKEGNLVLVPGKGRERAPGYERGGEIILGSGGLLKKRGEKSSP